MKRMLDAGILICILASISAMFWASSSDDRWSTDEVQAIVDQASTELPPDRTGLTRAQLNDLFAADEASGHNNGVYRYRHQPADLSRHIARLALEAGYQRGLEAGYIEGFEAGRIAEREAQQTPPGINLNTATIAELDELWGIGPTLAQRIVDARPFTSVNELTRVAGIGDYTLHKIIEQGLATVE